MGDRPGSALLVIDMLNDFVLPGAPLEEILRKKRIERLTITGIFTNICVFFTSADAVMRGFAVEVVRDCVAALTRDEHDFALDQVEKVLKVELR